MIDFIKYCSNFSSPPIGLNIKFRKHKGGKLFPLWKDFPTRKVYNVFYFTSFSVISGSRAEYIPLSGPVYINPNAASSSFESETTQNEPGERITQTVYGFLDFTTTIGNTVMVFSPQSAAPGQYMILKKINDPL